MKNIHEIGQNIRRVIIPVTTKKTHIDTLPNPGAIIFKSISEEKKNSMLNEM